MFGLQADSQLRYKKCLETMLHNDAVYLFVDAASGRLPLFESVSHYVPGSTQPIVMTVCWSNPAYPTSWCRDYQARGWQLEQLTFEQFLQFLFSLMEEKDALIGVEWNQNGMGVEMRVFAFLRDIADTVRRLGYEAKLSKDDMALLAEIVRFEESGVRNVHLFASSNEEAAPVLIEDEEELVAYTDDMDTAYDGVGVHNRYELALYLQKASHFSTTSGVAYSLPLPQSWRLYQLTKDLPIKYVFLFGKKNLTSSFAVYFIENDLPFANDDALFKKAWLAMSKQVPEEDILIERKEVVVAGCDAEWVMLRVQAWVPVVAWIFPKENKGWYLHAITELSRFKGDMKSLEQLLKGFSLG